MRSLICGTAIALTVFSSALAAGESLTCAVRSTNEDGVKTDYKLRLELNFDTKSVDYYKDDGTGEKFSNKRALVSADDSKILLYKDSTHESYIDRKASTYFFQDFQNGIIENGTCKKT
jgi:hypothetical protein